MVPGLSPDGPLMHPNGPRWCPDGVATRKQLDFDTNGLPEAENLGIRSVSRDVPFEQDPRPWKVGREPKLATVEPRDNLFSPNKL